MYKNRSITFDASSIKYTSKETYFRDMHLFLKYARNVASIKDNELIRLNL